jgi:hypothetical protein
VGNYKEQRRMKHNGEKGEEGRRIFHPFFAFCAFAVFIRKSGLIPRSSAPQRFIINVMF